MVGVLRTSVFSLESCFEGWGVPRVAALAACKTLEQALRLQAQRGIRCIAAFRLAQPS